MQVFYDSVFLFLSLLVIIRGARLVVKYTPSIASFLGMSGFLASFLLVGVVSVLPEFAIAVISGLRGVPTLGLGTLFGSNVADLTLVLGIAALFAGKGLVIKSDFLKDDLILIAPLLLPLVLGLDGTFSQTDGAVLITAGFIVFFFLYIRNKGNSYKELTYLAGPELVKSVSFFSLGLTVLIGGAYATVVVAERLSQLLSLPEILLGVSFITLGTLIPELTFSIKAARAKEGELVLGDILGIVITDVTLVLGVMAFLSPFSFDPHLVLVTGFAMVFAALISLNFMRSGRTLSGNEGVVLILLYVIFLATVFISQGGGL